MNYFKYLGITLYVVKLYNRYYAYDENGNVWASAKSQGWLYRKGIWAIMRWEKLNNRQMLLF